MTGIERIAAERKRQIEVEGWTAEHDDGYGDEQIATVAACYALPISEREHRFCNMSMPLLWYLWPWERKCWKPTPDNRIRELEKAGALIAAEIDRLLRLEGSKLSNERN